MSSHIADRGVSVQSRFGKLRLPAISNRSSVRAVCGVCTSGSQPSPTGALSVQSAVYAPPAHSHLQPELCPCSLRCMHLRLTAISNRSSVRAVRGVCTSGSQPSPTGTLSCRTWFELTEVVCTVSSLPGGSGNSGSQLQLMDHKRQTVLQLVGDRWTR